MSHKIVQIGNPGTYRAYLDVDVEEAKRRYQADYGAEYFENRKIRVVTFDEEFTVSDVGVTDAK